MSPSEKSTLRSLLLRERLTRDSLESCNMALAMQRGYKSEESLGHAKDLCVKASDSLSSAVVALDSFIDSLV